jgi:hypothetical protein
MLMFLFWLIHKDKISSNNCAALIYTKSFFVLYPISQESNLICINIQKISTLNEMNDSIIIISIDLKNEIIFC